MEHGPDFSFHNSITTDYDFPSADDLFREGKILPTEVKKEITMLLHPLCALLHKIVKNERMKGSEVAKIIKIEKQKKDKDRETKNTVTSSKQSQVLQKSINLPPCQPLCEYLNSFEANTDLRYQDKKKLQRKTMTTSMVTSRRTRKTRKTMTTSRNEYGIHSRPLRENLEAIEINRDTTQQEKKQPQRKTKTTSRNEEGIHEEELSMSCWGRKRSTSLSFSTLDYKATLCPTIPRLSRNKTVSSRSSTSSDRLTMSRDGQKHVQSQQKLKPFRNHSTPSSKKTNHVCLEKNHVCHGVGNPVIVPLVGLFCKSSECFSSKNIRNKN